MQALILAGGQGTRLRPLTENTPKPIVPIGNEPFIVRQIESLKLAGVTDITLALNYQPTAIEAILRDGSAFGVNLRYLIEPAPMGTAGAFKFAEKFLKTTTLVLNGDILTDIDLKAVAEHHKNHNAVATIVLTKVENPSAYGLVKVGKNDEVLGFLEKPAPEDIKRLRINTVNAGIYVFEPKVLDYIPKGENYSFEYQLFPSLLEKNEIFCAFVSDDDYWLDIGTPQRYLQAHHDLIAGKIKNLKFQKNDAFRFTEKTSVDSRSWIAEGCLIDPQAVIVNSVLGEGVIIKENSLIKNSVIWAGTKVESNTTVYDSIIGKDCCLGRNVSVKKGSVLGDRTVIADFTNY